MRNRSLIICAAALAALGATACTGDSPTSTHAPGADAAAMVDLAADDNVIISNGTIKLGVDRTGFIGVEGRFNPNDNPRDSIGLVYLPAGTDGLVFGDGVTSYGVEGWGIAAFYEPTRAVLAEAHSSGFDGQRAGLALESFNTTANSAVSITSIPQPSSAAPFVRITHDFHPAAATPNLYEVAVTFENVSERAVSDLRYTRQAYWRIARSFTTFATIQGTADEPLVARATDGGAGFSPRSSARGPIVEGAVGDFTDVGPNNHGAHFDFALGQLGPGETKTIYLYFGAAAGEAAATQAVAAVGANVYALGQSQPSGAPVTFVLAFKGEGNASPVAKTNGPFTAALGETIAFSGEGSSDPDGDPLTYSWDFGDGTTATGKDVSHAYTLQRSGFTVVLTVTDPSGATGTASTTVTLAGANQPPIADVNGPYDGDAGDPISFSSEGSRDPEGGAITYRWEFGDGSTSTDASPTHTYATAGSYVVRLTVTDPEGLTGTATAPVTVGGDEPPPPVCSEGTGAVPVVESLEFFTRQAVVGAGVTLESGPLVAELLRWRFSDPDCGPWRARIDWGNGVVDEFALPDEYGPGLYNTYHAYAASGRYTVVLTMIDDAGRESTARRIDVDVDISAASTSRAPSATLLRAGRFLSPTRP